MLAFFESMPWKAPVLSSCSHRKELQGMESEPMSTPTEKSLQPDSSSGVETVVR